MEKAVLDMPFGMRSKPFVVIWMVTYNHELYISEAIDSVMMQETNFDYCLYIGEDMSTDKTREICKEYARKYPCKIELLLNTENIGAISNAQEVYKKCFESGAKYIAMCEGDDFWTDPNKLQKQVDFLEKEENSNISIIVTHAHVYDDLTNKNIGILPNKKIEKLSFREYLLGDLSVFPVCTFLFRNDKFQHTFENFKIVIKNAFFGDGVLILFLLSGGLDLYLMDDHTASYRVNTGTSITSNKSNLFFIKSWIQTIKQSAPFFNSTEQKIINKHISIQYQRLAAEYLKVRNVPRAIQSMFYGMTSINVFNLNDLKDFYWRVFKS